MTRLDIAGLTPKERLDLIGELWDSLAPEDFRLTPAHEAELSRRMATFEANASAAVPWETSRPSLLGSPDECCVSCSQPRRGPTSTPLKWHEARAPEVAPQFREALRAAATRIAENPRQFPASPHQTRRALLPRFPYIVIFRVARDTAYVARLSHEPRPDGMAATDIMMGD